MPSAYHVIDHADDESNDEHDTRPVEALDGHTDLVRPERPEECVGGIQQRTGVDGNAPFA